MDIVLKEDCKNKSGVYKIASKQNPFKVYIGSTKNFYVRAMGHLSLLKRGKHPNNHLQRYFEKNNDLQFSVMTDCTIDKRIELEQLVLDEYKSLPHFELFNQNQSCEGREGMKHSDETKRKISASKKGVPLLSLRGKKFSLERRKKLSIVHTGLKSPIKGIPRTEEHRLAIKEGLRKMSPEEKLDWHARVSEKKRRNWTINKNKIIENRIKNRFQCKWIVQMDENGNELGRFHGLKYAAEILKINGSSISACLKNRRKHAGGFKWRYLIK